MALNKHMVRRGLAVILCILLMTAACATAFSESLLDTFSGVVTGQVTGDLESAIRIMESAGKLTQENALATVSLAGMYMQAGKTDKAYKTIDTALQAEPSQADLWSIRCMIDLLAGKYDTLEADLLAAAAFTDQEELHTALSSLGRTLAGYDYHIAAEFYRNWDKTYFDEEDRWAASQLFALEDMDSFLSSVSVGIAQAVSHDIRILLVPVEDKLNYNLLVRDIAQAFSGLNGHISFETVDLKKDAKKLAGYGIDAKENGLEQGSVIVTRGDGSAFRVIARADMYHYSYIKDDSSEWGYSYVQMFDGEAKLSSAILFLDDDSKPAVYFLTGHNEIGMDKMTDFTAALEEKNYDVKSLVFGADAVPGPEDTVIIANPHTDLADEEYEGLSEWLQAGGRLLVTPDNQTASGDIPNFTSLLAAYGLCYGDGYVVEDSDSADLWVSTPVLVVPAVNAENEITSSLAANGQRLLVYGGCPINRCNASLSGVQYDTLLSSSELSYVKSVKSVASGTKLTDRSDAVAEGSQVLACAAVWQPDADDGSQDTRIVLLSSVYMFADTSMLNSSYDLDFSIAAVKWLVNRDLSVSGIPAYTAELTGLLNG